MSPKEVLHCFKAYDVRGKLGIEINEDVAYRIGQATALLLGCKSIVLGFDARETSPKLAQAVAEGICASGSDVLEIGLAGTEEMYWAVSEFNADAGIEITASHNPIDYNGMKIVKSSSEPLSEKEFSDIRKLAEQNDFIVNDNLGTIFNKKNEARKAYIEKILSFVDLNSLKPLKIVVNSGNGAAGPVVDALTSFLKIRDISNDFVLVHHLPDPSFPNGIPNPLLEENRSATSDIVKKEGADFGVAFDGDFDRCFLFDHLGNFIPGEYVVGFIAEIFLAKNKGEAIVHDPRVIWNTLDAISKFGGRSIISKTGHAFMKKSMRQVGAIYGGEISAHHYFRDFAYCDSGMIPWLLVWEYLSKEDVFLRDITSQRELCFPSSGEINFKVADPSRCIEKLKNLFSEKACILDETDGISISFEKWRFNLRKSNTEPVVRLNVETLGDIPLLKKQVKELERLIAVT